MKSKRMKAVVVCGIFASQIQMTTAQQYLAVDFRRNGGDAPSDMVTDIRPVFEAGDPALTSAVLADFHFVTGGDGNAWNDLSTPTAFGAFTLTTSGQSARSAAAGSLSWTDMEPVLESYCWRRDGDADVASIMTISGISASAGDLITLTCWGAGDNTGQDSTFTATYAGNTAASQDSYFGDDRATGANAAPTVQFTFSSDGITDTIEFDWVRHSGRFCAFNAFSLSVETPSFGDVTAATLSAPGATDFIVGAPNVQMTATGTFTTAGLLDVSALGGTVVAYSSTNTSVAAVSATGLVTLNEPGTADITATVFGDNSSMVTTSAVTFNVEAPTNFNFSPLSDEINPNYLLSYGPTEDLDVTADSASLTGVAMEGYTGFSYSTSNAVIANVDTATGVVTPQDPGNAIITAQLLIPGGSPFTESITVTPEDANAITATIYDLVPADTLYAGGGGTTVTLEITSPNILTPYVVNNLDGAEFATDGGSDILVDNLSGVLTPGTSPLGDSVITGSWLLADGIGTITSDVTVTLASAPLKPTNLIHRYEFTGTGGAAAPSGTVIADSVGTADGTVAGTGAAASFSAAGDALVLPGGSDADDGAYVDLPDNMLSSIPSIDTLGLTFEAWMTKDGTDSWMRAIDFGVNIGTVSFVNVIAHRSGNGNVASEFTNNRGSLGTQFLDTSGGLAVGERSHLVMTIDPESGLRNIYLNGVSIASDTLAVGNRSIAAINDVNNWLGRSNAGADARLNGSFDEFCIYTGIMTASEVAANYAAGSGTGGLNAVVTSFSGMNLNVDVSGVSNGTTYHFARYNTGTSQFESISGTQFDAVSDPESRVIDTTGLAGTELIRLVEGAIVEP